jgi:Protein of unknown function (DUF4089)
LDSGCDGADFGFKNAVAMIEPYFDPAALVDAMSPLLKIKLAPESRAQVIHHLGIAAEQAEILLSAAIGDEVEPAPVYRS